MHFRRFLKGLLHIEPIKRAGQTRRTEETERRVRRQGSEVKQGKSITG